MYKLTYYIEKEGSRESAQCWGMGEKFWETGLWGPARPDDKEPLLAEIAGGPAKRVAEGASLSDSPSVGVQILGGSSEMLRRRDRSNPGAVPRSHALRLTHAARH